MMVLSIFMAHTAFAAKPVINSKKEVPICKINVKLQSQIDILSKQLKDMTDERDGLKKQVSDLTIKIQNNVVVSQSVVIPATIVSTKDDLKIQYEVMHKMPDCSSEVGLKEGGYIPSINPDPMVPEMECRGDQSNYKTQEKNWVNSQLVFH